MARSAAKRVRRWRACQAPGAVGSPGSRSETPRASPRSRRKRRTTPPFPSLAESGERVGHAQEVGRAPARRIALLCLASLNEVAGRAALDCLRSCGNSARDYPDQSQDGRCERPDGHSAHLLAGEGGTLFTLHWLMRLPPHPQLASSCGSQAGEHGTRHRGRRRSPCPAPTWRGRLGSWPIARGKSRAGPPLPVRGRGARYPHRARSVPAGPAQDPGCHGGAGSCQRITARRHARTAQPLVCRTAWPQS